MITRKLSTYLITKHVCDVDLLFCVVSKPPATVDVTEDISSDGLLSLQVNVSTTAHLYMNH